MSVISPSPVAKDSLSPSPADARSFEAPPPPFTIDAASAKYPNAANNDDADLFAARIADIGNTRTGDTPAADEGGGRDANGSVDHEATARRIVAAFVAHARAARNLPAEAEASRVIAAYFAPHAKGDADTAGRWLEDDTSLLLCLAKASGLFEGDVDAASLEAGHRRLLANALVLSLTRAIDWKAALGADGAGGATVFYDGITLRNATHLSLRDAAAAMDARIAQALDAAPGTKGLGAIVPQLRTALIGDPTLSFHPLPQTVRYGSRDWVNLWAGIEACKDADLNPALLSLDEVTAFGQAMSMARTPSAGRGHELVQNAVLLMAHAAGKVDLAQLREDNQAEITEKIQAFAAQEFKSEIALAEATARLLALGDPPTAQGIAEEALKELGLDPMAIVIEEPVSSKGKRLSFKLHDFYVRFNDLSEIEPGPYNNDLIAKIGDNAPRYKDVYSRKFDAYISNYIDAYKELVRVTTDIARQDGFSEGDPDASIRIDRIAITSPSDIQAYGFFIRYSDGKSLYRYFFSPSGIVEKIPDTMGREDWLRSNRHLALAAEDLKKIEAASGSEVNFKCSFDQLVRGQARRFDDAIDAEFRPKLLALKDQGAPVQDGVSRADRVLETVVPFYGVYTGIKRGDYVTAYLSFISGVVTLIPPAVAAGKLMAVGKKALFLGIQVAIGSFARRGLLKGAMLGVQYAGAYARALSIGAHAMHTASTAIDALAPGASSLLRRSYKYLRPETLRKAAAGLRGKFPGLAVRLRGRAGLLNTSGMKAPLWAKPRMAAPAVPAPGGVQAPFVRAVLDNGGTQWLQRFGTAYVRLDPYRLQPAGPVLLRASDGRLSPSLEISELTRNAVASRAMLDLLRRTPVSADGTIAVDGKTFAFIAGDYVQVEKATPFAAGGPVPWRTVPARPTGSGPQAPSTAEISTLLVYDARQGGWVSQAHHSSFQADRIGHRDGTMLPDGIVARYRISEATLRQTLASAARSGDGTIMLGGKRYAEIGGDFLEVLPDRATSTRERPIWRIAGAPLPGTRDGGPRLVWDKGQAAWRKAETVPRLQGGGGKPGTAGAGSAVTRRIDADAVKDMADRIVINPATIKPTRIADTETVRLAKTILGEATDLTHYPWWDNELDQYLDFYVANLQTSAYAKVDPGLTDPSNADRMEDRIVENMRRFLKDLYARSETFRGLANYARDNGILRKDLAWVMHIVAPDTLTNGTTQTSHRYHVTVRHPDAKKIVVPDVQAPPCWTPMAVNGETKLFGAVYDGGTVGPIASPATIVHEMMHFLTRISDPDGSSLDRGVVEYLAQRVLQESGVTQARRLTYAGWSEKPDKENLRRIEHYVRIQDEYLSKLFPMTDPPAEAWNPSAGNDRWLTADTTQPAGSQTQP